MKITPASLRSDPGRNHPEQVAGIDRNQWPNCAEYPIPFVRHNHMAVNP